MKETKILLIDDDEIVSRTIERSLRGKGFQLTRVNSGVEGLKVARHLQPALVILDVIMPGMDGFTVCREMRNDPILRDIPILFLTAKIKDDDKITGFNAGADDYLCKPFNIDELILRINAILRRARLAAQNTSEAEPQIEASLPEHVQKMLKKIHENSVVMESNQCLIVGDYILDTRSHELYAEHLGKILLTPVQYDLLYHLMSHPGQIFSPARLLDEVWNYPTNSGSSDLVRVHVKNLRERIEVNPKEPKFIRTVPGYGYTINPNA
jgi:DNA-binding response OmpR family regulator